MSLNAKLFRPGWTNRGLVFAGLLLTAFTCIYPVSYMFVTSFKTLQEYYQDPYGLRLTTFSIVNYRTMLSQLSLARSFLNSLVIVSASLVGLLVFSVTGAYAIARLRFPLKNAIYLATLSTMFIPAQVTIIPAFLMFSRVGLVNHPLSVILYYVASGIPFNLILLTAGFRGIPTELFEAAKIDGAGYFHTVWNVVVPVGQAVIAISAIMIFIGYWNDLLTPMVLLQTERSKTVMVALASLVTRYSGDPTYKMAGMTLAMLPTFLVYLTFQRYIVRGLTVGAIK